MHNNSKKIPSLGQRTYKEFIVNIKIISFNENDVHFLALFLCLGGDSVVKIYQLQQVFR